MRRPFTVCHMIAGIDGKIDGNIFETDEMALIRREAAAIRNEYDCHAILFGATTMSDTYGEGIFSYSGNNTKSYKREDYIADSDTTRYFVVFDPSGTVAYESKYIEKWSRPRSHIIVVLCENVNDEYIGYLRGLDISYIFVGRDKIDSSMALGKLNSLFNVQRLMVCGGAITNRHLLTEGLLDEVSLVIAPVTDCNGDTPTSFCPMIADNSSSAVSFRLKSVKPLHNSGVWLQYEPNNRKRE